MVTGVVIDMGKSKRKLNRDRTKRINEQENKIQEEQKME